MYLFLAFLLALSYRSYMTSMSEECLREERERTHRWRWLTALLTKSYCMTWSTSTKSRPLDAISVVMIIFQFLFCVLSVVVFFFSSNGFDVKRCRMASFSSVGSSLCRHALCLPTSLRKLCS